MPSQSMALKMIKYVADKPSAEGPPQGDTRAGFQATLRIFPHLE